MKRATLAFIAIAYALSIALSLAIGLTGAHESRLIGLGYLSMFLPSIAVLVVGPAMQEKVLSYGWNLFPLKYLPVALFLIPVVMHAVMLPMASILWGGLGWEAWLTPQADGLYHTPESRGWGVLTAQGLALRIATNAIFGLAFVSFLALFEETGWRAWLLPRLVDRMGTRRAVVAVAIISTVWHVPFALSGIHHIAGVSPERLALSLPLGIFGAGMILGWLWLRTESIWMVAIAHGALNNWGQYAFKFTRGTGQADVELILLSVGGLALFGVGVLLIVFGLPRSNACSVPAGSPTC